MNFKRAKVGLKDPAVKRPVLNGFEQVVGSDVFAGFEIGNGSGDFDDPVVGAGGKAELPDGLVQERLAGIVDPAEFFQVFGLHLGIRVNTLAGKPLELDVSCP